MRVTEDGLALIQNFESCALVAYKDQEGRWTLGWGRARGVSEGDTCTQDQADAWFLEDVRTFELLVRNCVGFDLPTDNQVSAVVSFCFNVGLGYKGIKDGFQVLKTGEPSTMLKCLRRRDFPWAAEEFPKWDKVGGAPCAGILRRRLAEQKMFLQPGGSDAKGGSGH